MQILSYPYRAVHVGEEPLIVGRVLYIGHDLPPLTETKEKIWKGVPCVLLFEPAELLFRFVELEIIHIVQRLCGFDLHLDIGDENNGCILFNRRRLAGNQ